jgi:hypothetical protein
VPARSLAFGLGSAGARGLDSCFVRSRRSAKTETVRTPKRAAAWVGLRIFAAMHHSGLGTTIVRYKCLASGETLHLAGWLGVALTTSGGATVAEPRQGPRVGSADHTGPILDTAATVLYSVSLRLLSNSLFPIWTRLGRHGAFTCRVLQPLLLSGFSMTRQCRPPARSASRSLLSD